MDAARANLIGTYLSLGQASAGARVWKDGAFTVCAGPLDHPVCNFAVDLRLAEGDAERLASLAAERRSFCVYTLPGDEPEAAGALERAGFTVSHRLSQMILERPEGPGAGVDVEEALTPLERRSVAGYMADQFFTRQPSRFRRGVADATAGAADLRLLTVERQSQRIAAVMVSEHGGVAGIYNLCVTPAFRGRGWGSGLVATVVGLAQERNAGVTLQCDPALVPWYARLGFKEVGWVSVFGLPRYNQIDIMGTYRS